MVVVIRDFLADIMLQFLGFCLFTNRLGPTLVYFSINHGPEAPHPSGVGRTGTSAWLAHPRRRRVGS